MKKILFDVDGTILDSMETWTIPQNKILEKYDYTIDTLTLEQKANIESLPYKQMCKYLADNIAVDMTYEEVLSYFSDIIDKAYGQELMPYEGAIDFLSRLKKKGFSMAVASSTPFYLIELAFKRLGIYDFFDFYATPDLFKLKKSDPEFWNLIIKKYQVRPQDCVLIDDALYAIQAAKKQGIKTIGIKDFPWNKKEWKDIEKEADIVYGRICDIDTNLFK